MAHCVLPNEIVGYTDFISYVWLYDTTLSAIVLRSARIPTRSYTWRSASPKVPFHTGKKVLLFLKIAPATRQPTVPKWISSVYRPLQWNMHVVPLSYKLCHVLNCIRRLFIGETWDRKEIPNYKINFFLGIFGWKFFDLYVNIIRDLKDTQSNDTGNISHRNYLSFFHVDCTTMFNQKYCRRSWLSRSLSKSSPFSSQEREQWPEYFLILTRFNWWSCCYPAALSKQYTPSVPICGVE